MEYKVGLCDPDYHYIVNLMEYVNSEKLGGLSLVAFSSGDAIEEYLKKGYLDGLIVGDIDCLDVNFPEKHSGVVIMQLASEPGIPSTVYKYQNARNIIHQVLDNLNVSDTPALVSGRMFCGIYSPVGRCGKTTLAKGLGLYYPGSLYVALEEFGTRDTVGEEILYHMIFQNIGIHKLMDNIIPNEYGLLEIKGILSYMDIRQLSRKNMNWFKEQLMSGTSFERVIFDIGAAVLSDLDILDSMDRIYIPVIDDETANIKLQAFRELLRREQYSGISRKIQYVNVPMCHYSSEMMRNYISKGEL